MDPNLSQNLAVCKPGLRLRSTFTNFYEHLPLHSEITLVKSNNFNLNPCSLVFHMRTETFLPQFASGSSLVNFGIRICHVNQYKAAWFRSDPCMTSAWFFVNRQETFFSHQVSLLWLCQQKDDIQSKLKFIVLLSFPHKNVLRTINNVMHN